MKLDTDYFYGYFSRTHKINKNEMRNMNEVASHACE